MGGSSVEGQGRNGAREGIQQEKAKIKGHSRAVWKPNTLGAS